MSNRPWERSLDGTDSYMRRRWEPPSTAYGSQPAGYSVPAAYAAPFKEAGAGRNLGYNSKTQIGETGFRSNRGLG